MEKLNWGIIGTARIADSMVNAIKKSRNANCIGIASRSKSRGKTFTDKLAVPFLGTYKDLLAQEAIDVVYIPLPNHLHHEWITQALLSGKHVLVEKPIVSSADQLRAIQALADDHSLLIMEGFMYRFHPIIDQIHRLLSNDAIGEIKFADFTFAHDIAKYLSYQDNYRYYKEFGGGSLLDLGIYGINFFDFLFGEGTTIEEIKLHHKMIQYFDQHKLKHPEKMPADHTSHVLLSFGNVLTRITSSFNFFGRGTRICGTEGELFIDDLTTGGNKTLQRYNVHEEVNEIISFNKFDLFEREVTSFSQAIVEKKAPLITLDQSMRTQSVLEEIL